MIGGFGVPGINLKTLGAQLIDSNPVLKSAVTVSETLVPAVQKLTDPKEGLSSLKTTLVDSVKLAAADASATAVKNALDKAGVAATNTAESLQNSISKAAENAQEKAEGLANETASENNSENSGNGNENGNENENAGNENENAGNENENAGNEGGNNANAGGGHKYEVVTLSSPIYEPLFVCYESGKPVYFTKNSKGITILKLHDNIEARYRAPPPAVKKKKVLTKKKKKKSKKKATKSK